MKIKLDAVSTKIVKALRPFSLFVCFVLLCFTWLKIFSFTCKISSWISWLSLSTFFTPSHCCFILLITFASSDLQSIQDKCHVTIPPAINLMTTASATQLAITCSLPPMHQESSSSSLSPPSSSTWVTSSGRSTALKQQAQHSDNFTYDMAAMELILVILQLHCLTH